MTTYPLLALRTWNPDNVETRGQRVGYAFVHAAITTWSGAQTIARASFQLPVWLLSFPLYKWEGFQTWAQTCFQGLRANARTTHLAAKAFFTAFSGAEFKERAAREIAERPAAAAPVAEGEPAAPQITIESIEAKLRDGGTLTIAETQFVRSPPEAEKNRLIDIMDIHGVVLDSQTLRSPEDLRAALDGLQQP